MPTNAHELLPLLQPTTKALAQVLAGNTRASGQLVNARNVLEQAERFIDERMADRLIPAQREEFFEQVARLKLTLADAEAAAIEEEEAEPVEPKRPAPAVPLERLRELALSLSTPIPAPTPPSAPVDESELGEAALPEEPPPPVRQPAPPRNDIPEGSPRSARLRLKSEERAAKGREGRA